MNHSCISGALIGVMDSLGFLQHIHPPTNFYMVVPRIHGGLMLDLAWTPTSSRIQLARAVPKVKCFSQAVSINPEVTENLPGICYILCNQPPGS